jgi:hypothetical protein
MGFAGPAAAGPAPGFGGSPGFVAADGPAAGLAPPAAGGAGSGLDPHPATSDAVNAAERKEIQNGRRVIFTGLASNDT